jgi:hypothetical protein
MATGASRSSGWARFFRERALQEHHQRQVARQGRRRAAQHEPARVMQELASARQGRGETVVGQEAEIHLEQRAPRALGLALERRGLGLEACLLGDEPRRDQREAQQEAARRDPRDLLLERMDRRFARAAAHAEDGPRREPRHLRRDAHERAEVQVEATVDAGHELRVLRHDAAEGAERLAEAVIREVLRDRPGERRGGAGQRFADVGAGPHGVLVAAFGETFA